MKKKLKMLLLLITTCVLIVGGANVTTSYASGGRMRQGHTGAHTWVQTFRKGATCTAYGCVQYKCKYCGKTKKQAIKPLGHSYYVARRYSDYYTAGYNTYTCRRCGYVTKRSMGTPKLKLSSPTLVNVKRTNPTTVYVSWKKVKDAEWYYVYSSDGKYKHSYKSTVTHCSLTSISEGKSVTYYIRAVKYRGNCRTPNYSDKNNVAWSNATKINISSYYKPCKVSDVQFSYNNTYGTCVSFSYDKNSSRAQIDYCVNSNFKGGVKRIEVGTNRKWDDRNYKTYPIGFLKSGKYYVRIRLIRYDVGVYGDWYYTTMTVK